MKSCTNKSCKQSNPQSLDCFKIDSKTKKSKSNCRSCEANAVKNWRISNPLKFKATNLKKYWPDLPTQQYLEEYNKLLAAQDDKCKICLKHKTEFKFALCVDHCHDTGKVRGLLCDNCNQALGLLKDDVDALKRAIEYIE
jgi:hypothetical protein